MVYSKYQRTDNYCIDGTCILIRFVTNPPSMIFFEKLKIPAAAFVSSSASPCCMFTMRPKATARILSIVNEPNILHVCVCVCECVHVCLHAHAHVSIPKHLNAFV